MKFNHLNVPYQWQHYWSRYPEGYTILEALLSWVKQVDDMTDNQNTLNDKVVQFRKEIDEFVGRFDERLQGEVTQTLQEWQTSGFLDIVIDAALDTKYHEMDNRLTAQLTQNTKKLNGRISVEEFGAVVDGETDDTQAIKDAISYVKENGGEILIPGKLLVTEPIVLDTTVKLVGYRNRSSIIKKNTTTLDIDGKTINSVIIIHARFCEIENVSITGDIDSKVNGISFGKNSSEFKFSDFSISGCLKAFDDYKECWVGEFNKIHCVNCEEGFAFNTNIEKTSLTFKNCWAENCGNPYDFNRLFYSTLINCASDWCNFKDVSNQYGDGGHGDKGTEKGVYNFSLCRNITMIACASENSYGNGVIKLDASVLNVSGLHTVNTKSEYKPPYSAYSAYAIGSIQIWSARSSLHLTGVHLGSFTNSYVDGNYPNKPQSLIAYNYDENAYGRNNKKMVVAAILGSLVQEVPVFSGMGDFDNDCILIDDIGNKLHVNDYIDIGALRQFKGLLLSTGIASNKLVIPIKPQGNLNVTHLIKIMGMNNSQNSSSARAFYASIQFASFTDVKQVGVVEGVEGLTAVGNGTNLEITLPSTYTDIRVECSALSQNINLIKFNEAYLV